MTFKQTFLLATPFASDRLRKMTGYAYVVKSKLLATFVIVVMLIGFSLIPPIVRDFAIGDFVGVAAGIGGFLITAALFTMWLVTRIATWSVERAKRRGEIVELNIVFVLGLRYLLESRAGGPALVWPLNTSGPSASTNLCSRTVRILDSSAIRKSVGTSRSFPGVPGRSRPG